MDPLGGVRSQAAQAKAVQRGVKGQLKMAKAAQSKAAKFDRKMVLHMLLYILFGLVLGTLAFVEFFGRYGGSVPKMVFLATAVLCVPLGMLHEGWLVRRAEGDRSPGAELLVTFITMLFLGVGIFLGHLFFPALTSTGGQPEFAWIIALSALGMLVPHLMLLAYEAAYAFEPRRYQLWYFPEDQREREPLWDKDRIVIANLHFKRKEHEPLVTTVNARLPMDASLGELVYLFIKDYNENRFPGSPIESLLHTDGSLGWLFHTRRFILPKRRKLAFSTRVLDPSLTIAENAIGRDMDIYFQRVITSVDTDE
jgi:hypothetical protein